MKIILPNEKSERDERDVEEIDFLLTRPLENVLDAYWISEILDSFQENFSGYCSAIQDFYSSDSTTDAFPINDGGHGLKLTRDKVLFFNPFPDELFMEIDKNDFLAMLEALIERKGNRSTRIFAFYSWGEKHYPQ